MADTSPGDRRGGPDALMRYWTTGPGAIKIRWGTDGSYDRCLKELSKHVSPGMVRGLCANLHKRATGEWPAEKDIPS